MWGHLSMCLVDRLNRLAHDRNIQMRRIFQWDPESSRGKKKKERTMPSRTHLPSVCAHGLPQLLPLPLRQRFYRPSGRSHTWGTSGSWRCKLVLSQHPRKMAATLRTRCTTAAPSPAVLLQHPRHRQPVVHPHMIPSSRTTGPSMPWSSTRPMAASVILRWWHRQDVALCLWGG